MYRVQWYAGCYTQKRLRELVVTEWSSTINGVLSVMFRYFLKLEEQKVLEAGQREKKMYFLR